MKLKETQFDSRLFKALVKLLHVYDKINSEKLTDPRTFCNFVCLPGKRNKPRFGGPRLGNGRLINIPA